MAAIGFATLVALAVGVLVLAVKFVLWAVWL